MSFTKTEKRWPTKSGLEAIVVITTRGTRNGYIVKQLESPLESYCFTVPFEDILKWTPELVKKQQLINNIEVHGGITYTGLLSEQNEYVVGFDCNHAWDAPDWEAADKLFGDDTDYLKFREIRKSMPPPSDTVIRTLDYCIEQCESLADQLKQLD